MMTKLTRDDLFSLEKYAEMRPEFRARVMAHKKNRQLPVGPNATLYFEDALTMHYQIQEMLRAERIFESAGIQEELDAYTPLIPDGSNWKATFMMEYPDEAERREQLARLIGIERHIWAQVADFSRITPIADEDLERETEEKTSSDSPSASSTTTGAPSASDFMRISIYSAPMMLCANAGRQARVQRAGGRGLNR